MAKLSELAPTTIPTRIVEVRPAGTEQKLPVGIRLLSALERAGVYQRAKAAAKLAGSTTWEDNDPNCALELYVETVAACTFDVDGEPNAFEPWATPDQLRKDRSIGQENLLFIFEAYEAFEQEHSVRPEDLQGAALLTTIWRAGAGDLRPLERMRRGTLQALVGFLANLHMNSTIGKSSNISDSVPAAGPMPTEPPANS